MIVKVLKEFIDKETKILHSKDAEISLSKERFEELNSTAHGILVMEIKNDGDLDDYADKYPLTEEHLSSYSKKELVLFANDRGIELDMKMAKAKMIELLKSR